MIAGAEPWRSGRRLFHPRSIAIAGIGLGLLACWLALPPLTTRTILWPVAVGILSIAAGVWAVTRGAGRPAWFALVAGLAGIALGVAATQSSVGHLDTVVVWSALLASTLRYATPLVFAAIGGMFSERSGVVNIGLEGMMLTGAFFGIWADDWGGSWIVGLLVAMAAGGAMALVHAFFSIHLRADQIVSGTAINFLALGITGFMFIAIYGDQGTPSEISRIPDVRLSNADTGWAATFGQLNLMIWLAALLLVVSYIVMFKTPIGLRIRSVGEHPKAADTVGISVFRVRYCAVVVSGMLAALGGAYLSFGFGGSFNENMTIGKGFIGLAAMIAGNWRPLPAFTICLLFGFSDGLGRRLQGSDLLPSVISSPNLLSTLPYIITLIALVGIIGRSRPPASVGRPYVKQ
jgi:simple sugar transport system permease protein